MSKIHEFDNKRVTLESMQINDESTTPKLCFKRMLIMSIASIVLTSFLIHSNSCSGLLSKIGIFFNIISWIILVIYSFIIYYKRNGLGLKK